MRFIAIVSLWLGLITSCLAAPSQFLNIPDSLGQYSFGYSEPMSSRSEYRSLDGMTRGTYSYVDPNGLLQTSDYEAGQDLGFLVKATNLPQAPLPVKEAPEILAARQKHLQLLDEANRRENSDRALSGKNEDFPVVPESRNAAGGITTKPEETVEVKREDLPEELLKFSQQAEIKQQMQKELISKLAVKPDESSRSNAAVLGLPMLPQAIQQQPITFPGFGFEPIKGFPEANGRDANSLSLPKDDTSFLSSLKNNANFLSLPKGDANLLNFPKGDANLLNFPKVDADFPLFSKSEAFPSSLSSNTDFLHLPKSDVIPEPSAKSQSNFQQLPKNDSEKNAQTMTPQASPAEASMQREAAPLPEPVKDTPEVAAAREAHLRIVSETAAKLAEPVKDTPEVIAAREAHLRAAAEPNTALPMESVKYTPEVQAARDNHFRAYEAAAKLAAESDANPKILEQVLRNPSALMRIAQKMGGLESLMLAIKSNEEFNRMMGSIESGMRMDNPATRTDAMKAAAPLKPDDKRIANLAEKPQIKDAVKPAEVRVGSGITPASTSLRVMDTRLPLLNEFEQSKLKAAIDLTCTTALKVKDSSDVKPTEDGRLIIIKAGEYVPVLSTDPLPVAPTPQLKNWAFQYTFL